MLGAHIKFPLTNIHGYTFMCVLLHLLLMYL